MVTNEVFVGAGTSATLVPEMDMFFNAGTVGGDSTTTSDVVIAETTLLNLLDNLYVGCRAKVESTTMTTYTTVKSNTRTRFTFNDPVGVAVSDAADITLYGFGAPVVAPKNGSRPQLLSDNWLGLVNTITPPNVEVELKQMNLAVSGTRNFAHQYKGAETVSGGSLDISLNNGSWLYYALGNISNIETSGNATDWGSSSNGFIVDVNPASSDRILRVIGGNEFPMVNNSGADYEHDTDPQYFKELDTSSEMITYTMGELNGDTLQ